MEDRNKTFVETYKGYDIYRSDWDMLIYQNGCLVDKVECHHDVGIARITIDWIIRKNQNQGKHWDLPDYWVVSR